MLLGSLFVILSITLLKKSVSLRLIDIDSISTIKVNCVSSIPPGFWRTPLRVIEYEVTVSDPGAINDIVEMVERSVYDLDLKRSLAYRAGFTVTSRDYLSLIIESKSCRRMELWFAPDSIVIDSRNNFVYSADDFAILDLWNVLLTEEEILRMLNDSSGSFILKKQIGG